MPKKTIQKKYEVWVTLGYHTHELLYADSLEEATQKAIDLAFEQEVWDAPYVETDIRLVEES